MISKYADLKNNIDVNKIKEAAKSIKKGELVLFPTETVYGIGANALNKKAVDKIFIAKGRAGDNPLIVHISDLFMLQDLVEGIGPIEKKLIDKFWPGPLTIEFKKKQCVPDNVTANLNTVGIRMPENEVARRLIEYSRYPIAAPSANISGKPSGTKIEDIIEELDGKVDYILDAGQTDIGVESTVIRVKDNVVNILRPGKITVEDIESLGIEVNVAKQVMEEYKGDGKVMSPGMKYKHYAPKTKCLLVYSKDNDKLVERINEEINQNENVLVLSKTENIKKFNTKDVLDMGETLEEISRNIFTLLRRVDRYNADLVIIQGVEKEGLGLAIMNRLIRACSHNYIEF